MTEPARHQGYISLSPSDPNKVGLHFNTLDAATKHTNAMNDLLSLWHTSQLWDKQYWREKPARWRIYECVAGDRVDTEEVR